MRNPEEFKAEVFRRAEKELRRQARKKRQIRSFLSMAACFVLVVGVVIGAPPLLQHLMAEGDANVATADGTTEKGTPAQTTPQMRPAPTTPAYTPAPTTPANTPASTTPAQTLDQAPADTTPVQISEHTTPRATSTPVGTVTQPPVTSVVPTSTTPAFTTPHRIIVRVDMQRADADSVEIIPHTSPVLPEEYVLLPFATLDAYKGSPYFCEGVLADGDFEEYTVYLLMAPVENDRVAIEILFDETSVVQELAANVEHEGKKYCVYVLLVCEMYLDIEISYTTKGV